MKRIAYLAVVALVAIGARAGEANLIPIPGRTNVGLAVKSLTELRFQGVVRQAFDLSCGAAALATVMRHFYGEDVTELELLEDMLATGDRVKIATQGFSMLELKRASEKRGYASAGFRIEDARDLARLKSPVITLINSRGYAHFVVVKGIERGRVKFADPAFGNLSRSLDRFEAEWSGVILVLVDNARHSEDGFRADLARAAPTGQVKHMLSRGLTTVRASFGEY